MWKTLKREWIIIMIIIIIISVRRSELIIINNNNKTEHGKLWTLLSRLTTKLNWKKGERRANILSLLENWKKLWNIKVTFMPIVIGALGTVAEWLLKGLEDLEIRGRMETIQTTALLRSARILRRVLETWGDLWKTIK